MHWPASTKKAGLGRVLVFMPHVYKKPHTLNKDSCACSLPRTKHRIEKMPKNHSRPSTQTPVNKLWKSSAFEQKPRRGQGLYESLPPEQIPVPAPPHNYTTTILHVSYTCPGGRKGKKEKNRRNQPTAAAAASTVRAAVAPPVVPRTNLFFRCAL